LAWTTSGLAQVPYAVTGALPAAGAVDPTATLLKPSQWKLLQATLDQVDSHGFILGEFSAPGMAEMLGASDAATRAQGGRLLIAAVLRYAKAVKTGRLALADFPNDWGLRPAPYDPGPDFLAAVAADNIAGWLASLPPPYSGYQALRQGLINWRKAAVGGDWPAMPGGVKLTPASGADPRVSLLRHKLAALGYPVDSAKAGWDASLTEAVMSFQRRHGMTPDGIVAASTLEAINVPPSVRERQIIANLERWRWLPPALPGDRVQVNIVAGVLTLFRGGAPVMSMRAVAGKIGDETPMLSSQIHSVVLNPPWNVPSSIASKELWPKERAHPGYLARAGYKVVTSGGSSRIVQPAGPHSSLGQVKFDFQNPYGVYLHDTPTHGTFARDERLASHGCVRLERPVDLAKELLKDNAVWTPDAIDARIAGDDTTRVPLSQTIAVFLLYWTAYAGTDGQINFRADRYGWDELLLKLIGRGQVHA
jgi:murein L,D-transpeptidase YcbB/YkuD